MSRLYSWEHQLNAESSVHKKKVDTTAKVGSYEGTQQTC